MFHPTAKRHVSLLQFLQNRSLLSSRIKSNGKNNSQDVAEERAAKVFQQLDVNDDGELNEEEFVFGALKV